MPQRGPHQPERGQRQPGLVRPPRRPGVDHRGLVLVLRQPWSALALALAGAGSGWPTSPTGGSTPCRCVGTVLTLLLVAVLENEQWRNAKATQRKLNALAAALAHVMAADDTAAEHIQAADGVRGPGEAGERLGLTAGGPAYGPDRPPARCQSPGHRR